MIDERRDAGGGRPRPAGGVVVGVIGLFLLAVGGAWGWFHVQPRRFPTRLRMEARAQVPGYSFRSEPVSRDVLDLLAVSTNDLVSGVFQRERTPAVRDPERVSVFYAGWSARSAREMSVVMHTPDVCWVGAGAVPVALGQPGWVDLTLGAGTASFECRVFELQPGRRELTLWCTLVNGQAYGEAYRFAPAPGAGQSASAEQAKVAAGRRAGGNQFLHALRERVPGTGDKQFVRLSLGVDGQDWAGALGRLKAFAGAWLTLHVDAGSHPRDP